MLGDKIMQTATVKLSDLRFGHEAPQGGINDRVTGRDTAIAELAAMIQADGLIQPPAIWWNGNKECAPPYYIIAGNRRLAALRLIVKEEKRKDQDADVSCVVIEAMDMADALAKAAASNMVVPVHPVDRYETFARLAAKGMNAAAISNHYGIGDSKEVERSLALGALAPVVRNAWREAKISREVAQCFTLEPDQKRQAAVFEKLKKSHSLHSTHYVRQAILGDTSKLRHMVKVATRAAYEKAGGKFAVDLFADEGRGRDDGPTPLDLPLLKRLVDDRLMAEATRLQKAGWKWVKLASELPPNTRYRWDSHDGEKGEKTPPKVKALTGCIIDVDHDGVDIDYAILMPKDAQAAVKAAAQEKAAKPKKAKVDPRQISNALDRRLDRQLAKAVKTLLVDWSGPGVDDMGAEACRTLAAMIDPERLAYGSVKIETIRKLRNSTPWARASEALSNAFDAKDYFSSIPKALVVKLVRDDMAGKAPVFNDKTIKSGELVAIAVKHAAARGWLPLQLRPAETKAKR